MYQPSHWKWNNHEKVYQRYTLQRWPCVQHQPGKQSFATSNLHKAIWKTFRAKYDRECASKWHKKFRYCTGRTHSSWHHYSGLIEVVTKHCRRPFTGRKLLLQPRRPFRLLPYCLVIHFGWTYGECNQKMGKLFKESYEVERGRLLKPISILSFFFHLIRPLNWEISRIKQDCF